MPDEIKSGEEPTVVIEEEVGKTKEGEGFSIDGLDDAEVEIAKKHGLVKEPKEEKKEENKDGNDKKQSDVKTETDPDKKEEEIESPTFEQVEANEEKLFDKKAGVVKGYNRNETSLYFKWKADKHKRQEAQKEANELKEKLKEAVDSGVSGKKLDKIKELLKNPDGLTIEALTAAIDEKIEPEKKPNELDNAQAIQNKVAIKAQFAEKIGSAKYEKFNEISNLAKEVIQADTSKTYQKLIDESFLNDEVDENTLVERVVNIARMSPKFNEVVNRVDPEAKEKANRVIENSKKKPSSASVTGASGKRIISESELTVEQATKLSTEQWNKLKPETRKRILMGQNP